MRTPSSTSIANIFLANQEQNWLCNSPLKHRSLFYRRYVLDIFLLFKSYNHLKDFEDI